MKSPVMPIYSSRVFRQLSNGKLTTQLIGGRRPYLAGAIQAMAMDLNLPEPETYTSHAFRRALATRLGEINTAGRWKRDKLPKINSATSQKQRPKLATAICGQAHTASITIGGVTPSSARSETHSRSVFTISGCQVVNVYAAGPVKTSF
jgi:hypothetical protein